MYPPTSAAKIPSITVLRHELDYGEPRLTRCDGFYDDMRVFRKTYLTHTGVPGNSFVEWKSKDHQKGLLEMTDAYLDRDGKGAHFWPDDRKSTNYNILQYSTARDHIKRQVLYLLFRLNLQQYRNKKYKHKSDDPDNASSLRLRGLSTDDPIEVESIHADRQDSLPSRSTCTLQEPYSTIRFRAARTNSETLDPALGSPAAELSNARDRNNDLYAVPDSREPSISAGQSRFRAFSKSSRDDHRDLEPPPQEPPKKRAKKQHATTKSPKDTPQKKLGRPAKSKWTSPREKQTRRDSIWATEEQLQRTFRSPSDSPSLRPVGDNMTGIEAPTLAPMAPMSPLSDGRSRLVTLTVPPSADKDHTTAEVRAGQLGTSPSQASSSTVVPLPASLPDRSATSVAADPRPHHRRGIASSSTTLLTAPRTFAQLLNKYNSTIPDSHSDTTSPEVATAVAAQPTRADDRDETPKRVPGKKPALEMTYKVIVSRGHPPESTTWVPSRGFQKMSLAQFVKEIPLELELGSKGLRFTFLGPNVDLKGRVYHGEGKQFESMKQSIDEIIRSCIAQREDEEETLQFELEIEMIRNESATASKNMYEGELDEY